MKENFLVPLQLFSVLHILGSMISNEAFLVKSLISIRRKAMTCFRSSADFFVAVCEYFAIFGDRPKCMKGHQSRCRSLSPSLEKLTDTLFLKVSQRLQQCCLQQENVSYLFDLSQVPIELTHPNKWSVFILFEPVQFSFKPFCIKFSPGVLS